MMRLSVFTLALAVAASFSILPTGFAGPTCVHNRKHSKCVKSVTSTSSSTTPFPSPTSTPATNSALQSSGSSGTSGGGTSQSDIDQYLSAHNTFRAKHGANPLTWNDTLASYAQKWVNGCKFQHSAGPYGENLAAGTGDFGIAAGIKLWTDEASDYDPTNPQPSHFTQVVWKSSTQVGCAVSTCSGIFDASFGKAQYYTCEYSPPGNYIGEFAQNVQV